MNEGQLLERFVARRDEAAFAALVARYGPMVLGVCRQMLHDPNDVDDAFQATFLVLVRKAGTLRNRDLLGNWLYGVAYKVAHRARTVKARRHATETPCVEELAMGPDHAGHQPQPWIHEEVQRLPEKYRTPVVLCYLQGLTHEEAAERLRWPLGTVKGRLARAREMLRSRLTRRGMAFSSGVLFLELARDASATVPNSLVESTIRAATAASSGRVAVGLISAQAVALSEGVLRTMFMTQLKTVGVLLLVAGLLTTSAGVVAYQAPGPGRQPVTTESAPVSQIRKSAQIASNPEVARDLQKAQEKASTKAGATETTPQLPGGLDERERSLAQGVFDDLYRLYRDGEMNDVERANTWSLRVLEAESHSQAGRRPAAKAHLKRMESLLETSRKRFDAGHAARVEVAEADFYVIRAQKLLENAASAGPVQATASSGPASDPAVAGGPTSAAGGLVGGMGGGGMGGGMGRGMGMAGGPVDRKVALERVQQGKRVEIARISEQLAGDDESPKNKAILKKLEEPVSMSFAHETPLDDVIKYIKSAVQGANDSGIPIYVDPAGLQEAETKMTTPVQLDLEGVPLKTTLRLLLKQVKLAYCVKEGVLIISSVNGIYNELQEIEATTDDPLQ